VPVPLFAPRAKLTLQHPLPWSHISPEWVAKNAKDFDPSGIATIPSDILITMNRFLGCGEPLKEPPEGQVHLIVTTRRLKRQQRREDEKERDALSDLRLMHRSEVLPATSRYVLLTASVYTQITSLSSRALASRRRPSPLNQANMQDSKQTPRRSSMMASITLEVARIRTSA